MTDPQISTVSLNERGVLEVHRGAAITFLYPPFAVLEVREFDQWSDYVVKNVLGTTVITVADEASNALLGRLPKAHDPAAAERVLAAKDAARPGPGRSQGEPSAPGRQESATPPSRGSLKFDGDFVTLDVEGQAPIFFVADRDRLPLVRSAQQLEDGGLAVDLEIFVAGTTGSRLQKLRVPPEDAYETSRAIALCRGTSSDSAWNRPPAPPSAPVTTRSAQVAPRPASSPVPALSDVAGAAASRASAAARVVEVWGWLTAIIGAIAGLIVAMQTDEYGLDEHPYVGVGAGIAVVSILQGSFLIMTGAYVVSRTYDRRASL